MKNIFRVSTFYLTAGLVMHLGCNTPKPKTTFSVDHPGVEAILSAFDESDYYEKCRKFILTEGRLGQDYYFSIEGRDLKAIKISYLGDIVTSKSDTLRVLNSINYWGASVGSMHATGRVFIYNSQNKRLGQYYVGGAIDLPSKVDNGSLVFSYANDRCDQTTFVSLRDSIPKQIFVSCTNHGGDIYTFTNDYF